MPEQCIEVHFSLEELGCSPGKWEQLSLRLLPPRSTDFNEEVLSEVLSRGDQQLSAAALLFAAEFERYMGRDSRILTRLFQAVEVLPDNTATLRALVDELESFHRPAEALPYAERLAAQSLKFGGTNESDLWRLGKMRFLAGDKQGAVQYWRTLPFYRRHNGEELLRGYVEACGRRLAQYAQNRGEKNS